MKLLLVLFAAISTVFAFSIDGIPVTRINGTTVFGYFNDNTTAIGTLLNHSRHDIVIDLSTNIATVELTEEEEEEYSKDNAYFNLKRDKTITVLGFPRLKKIKLINHKTIWSHWSPASACLWTTFDPAGGSDSINWNFSIEGSLSAGLNIPIIQQLIPIIPKAELALHYSKGNSATCNIPGKLVGQLWVNHALEIVEAKISLCDWFGILCTGFGGLLNATIPLAGDWTTGFACNTGLEHVSCSNGPPSGN